MKAKKGDIVHKLKIARGQLDGILQMVEENRYCVDIPFTTVLMFLSVRMDVHLQPAQETGIMCGMPGMTAPLCIRRFLLR
ncbi:protein containing DUF156 [human gut metagenome]|uniref:Protein containing DUF156 n=1 Tax=human gut metagenome TaxID=408170 RepID=K1T0L3_9ZZZZ